MTTGRAFRLIHNLDVPEAKRKFWPQWSTVVVDRQGRIEDVIQCFDSPNDILHRQQMGLYPTSVQFTAKAGEMYLTIDELEKKLKDCVEVWEWEEKQKGKA